ncbi:hypothetical protein [Pigmentiphaga sp. D-2]|uniref:hypothetical protein n=1 Tax=Pigmentiphaga sp. D-2 TaxID=1002116 RepID=UPI00104AEDFD|nr:hypothetical protein [Pigmentiphaga sp. D-2]
MLRRDFLVRFAKSLSALVAGSTLATNRGEASSLQATANTPSDSRKGKGLLSPHMFGGICDGKSRPLSLYYSSIEEAQRDYPAAISLQDELDGVAIQKMFDYLSDGQSCFLRGTPRVNTTLYLSNKNNVSVDASAAVILIDNGPRFCLVVHGGKIDRNLSGADWSEQLVQSAYEKETPCRGLKIDGLRVNSVDSARRSTQLLAYFCDDAVINAEISNSNGAGLELRHCVNVQLEKLVVRNFSTYGLFIYQCHGVRVESLQAYRGGRIYAIKQRHKFYPTLDHVIHNIRAVDLRGFDDKAWATGGDAFDDESRRLGRDSHAALNRNFPGHEIAENVSIENVTMMIEDASLRDNSNPSIHIGCYAKNWKISNVVMDFNGGGLITIPLLIGGRGDIQQGKASNATFGGGHIIEAISAANINATNANAFVNYAVDSVVNGLRLERATLGCIVSQLEPEKMLPVGGIDKFELKGLVADINLLMGGIQDRGIRILKNTRLFVSENLVVRVKPVNYGSSQNCCPIYVAAKTWKALGVNSIEIETADSRGSNHRNSIGLLVDSSDGDINFSVAVSAPSNATAIYAGKDVTPALHIQASQLTLYGVPTSKRVTMDGSGKPTLFQKNKQGAWIN